MSRIYFVRHGRAAADWASHVDPGLDDLGRLQAEKMADRLAPKGPLPLLTSPLRRTRETTSALERRWNIRAQIERRVAEIPSPIEDLASRAQWLQKILKGCWSELDEALAYWRGEVLQALRAIQTDTVIVSHFIAINVAVGHAIGDDKVVCFRPDHCSCTLFEIVAGKLDLIELGAEGATRVI